MSRSLMRPLLPLLLVFITVCIICIVLPIAALPVTYQNVGDCDLIIAGGSLSALAAAISAANASRAMQTSSNSNSNSNPKDNNNLNNNYKYRTCLLEPTNWAGGQLTASNVPPDFGAYNRYPENLPRDFVDLLTAVTGGSWASNPGGCWVSTKCFDANLAAEFIKDTWLPSFEPELRVYYNAVVKNTKRTNDKLTGLDAIQRATTSSSSDSAWSRRLSDDVADWYSTDPSENYSKNILHFHSFSSVVEATEWGDVLMTSGVDVSQGVESPSESSFDTDSSCGQMTVFPFYMSYNSNYPDAIHSASAVPLGSDGGDSYTFNGGTLSWTENWSYRRSVGMDKSDMETFSQGEQSNQNLGNDFSMGYLYKNLPDSYSESQSESGWMGGLNLSSVRGAEERAFGWFHFVANTSLTDVRPYLGINFTQVGTGHGLSKVPYIRDTRRSKRGIEGFRLSYQDLNYSNPEDNGATAFHFEDTVAIGNYHYADVHELNPSVCKMPDYITSVKHPILPYYIPFRALTSSNVSNVLFAGKSMAQTFLANAGTRLHPSEWSSGAAAGAAALLMAKSNWTVSDMYSNVKDLQKLLTSDTISSPITWDLSMVTPAPSSKTTSAPSRGESSALLQATWLPVQYHCYNSSTVLSVFQGLKTKGVTRVYVDVWNNGKVYFNSPVMMNAVGEAGYSGDDLLQWSLDAGAQTGIEVMAWFEYGLMASYTTYQDTNAFYKYAKSQGWIVGEYNSFLWMDSSRIEVLDFISGIIIDAIKGYSKKGLKGVQLDDHFGQPVALGGNVNAMSNAMYVTSSRVRQHCADNQINSITFSLSPSTLDFALQNAVDWAKWGDNGWYDEVIPQLYRSTFADFKSAFDYTNTNLINPSTRAKWIASGLRCDGSGNSTSWNELSQMIDYTTNNFVGSSVWYARGILETYPSKFGDVW